MYIIKRISASCYGREDKGDRYITGNNKIINGELRPELTEVVKLAKKFKTEKEANEKIERLNKAMHFPLGKMFEIEEI